MGSNLDNLQTSSMPKSTKMNKRLGLIELWFSVLGTLCWSHKYYKVNVQLIDCGRPILQSFGKTCFLYSHCQFCRDMVKSWLFSPSKQVSPQNTSAVYGNWMTILHSPTPWWLKGITFVLCSNSLIYINSTRYFSKSPCRILKRQGDNMPTIIDKQVWASLKPTLKIGVRVVGESRVSECIGILSNCLEWQVFPLRW